MSISLNKMQNVIVEEGLDGWLFYDFHGKNHLMKSILHIPEDLHITRRVLYFIPKNGDPLKIVHKIEPNVLAHLPGETYLYSSQQEFFTILKKIRGVVALEYSKEIPAVSCVDGGTIDLLREIGVEVASSHVLIQKFLSVLTERQIGSHLDAAAVLDKTVTQAFQFLKNEKWIYEGDVQEFILHCFKEHDCITEYPPIVARGMNSANPHYAIAGKGDRIEEGDFVLIDLWCKKNHENAVYADITRVGSLKKPSQKMLQVFNAVKEAQLKALHYIQDSKNPVRGCDVDALAREYLCSLGFKEAIYHRLGHSIDTSLHGSGANLDGFETIDKRILVPNTCYSIEPALYFPGEFGIRLEFDIIYYGPGKVEVTGGIQESVEL